MVEGIIYRYRCGIVSRDVPTELGPWQTLWKRHRRYSGDGTWDRVLARLLTTAEDRGVVDWAVSVALMLSRAPGTAVGTLLSVWSLAFFYAPNAVPPMPSFASLTALAQPIGTSPAFGSHEVPAAAEPQVVPGPAATTTPLAAAARSPEQTRSDMQVAAGTISFVLKNLRTPLQPWPTALFINADRLVSTPDGQALFRIPVGTIAEYARSISGQDYRLTITDDSSGAGVTFDSATGFVTNN